jgi:hypothetical protein
VPTAEPFPADARLPQLARACDPEHMAGVLGTQLKAGHDVHVERCDIETFRHRAGGRTLVKYGVQLAGACTGRWSLTGLLYAEPQKARATARKLAAEARAVKGWRAPFEPVGFIDALGMVVQAYPFDRRLPALPHVAAGPPPALAGALAEHAGLDGARPPGWTSELVRYRPQLGAVLRYTLHAGRSTRRYYVKVYPAAATRPPGDYAWAARSGFQVALPLFAIADGQVVVLPEVSGMPLDRWLIDGRDGHAAGQVVAVALAAFHQGDARPQRRVDVAQHLTGVERAAAYVSWARPDLLGALARICAAVRRALDAGAGAPTHRDLKPDHVLIADAGPALVDLDSCALADPMLDPATLLARLRGLPFEHAVGPLDVDAAAGAFRETYLSSVPPSWGRRLQPLYAGALVELAASLFRRQVPGWQSALDAVIENAIRCSS